MEEALVKSIRAVEPKHWWFQARRTIAREVIRTQVIPALGLGSRPPRILDAGAGGVPVVATRAGGIPETIQDGVTGLLVPPAEPEELARAILELANDPERCKTMAAAAREWVRTSRSDERMVEDTLGVYRTLLTRGA